MCYYFWDLIHSGEDNLEVIENSSSPPAPAQYTVLIASILLCVIGLIGNAAVIYVTTFIMKNHKCRIWFLNLATADFVFLIFMPLDTVANFTGQWTFGSALCKTYWVFSTCNKYSSIFIITALNIERVLSVSKPIWHLRFFSRRIGIWICAVIWTVTVAFSFPMLLYADVYGDDGEKECMWFDFENSEQMSDYIGEDYSGDFSMTNTSSMWTTLYSRLPESREDCKGNDCCYISSVKEMWTRVLFIAKSVYIPQILFGCLIPLCIILLANITIGIQISKSKITKTPRLYKIVITVVLIYLITWTPSVIAAIIMLKGASTYDYILVIKVSQYLPFLEMISDISSCVNPIIYVLVDQRVQKALVCCRKKREENLTMGSQLTQSVRSTT
ncbi:hypothetical protein GDO86_013861 [Hymenochirus boettgeri]|uniref:G-protein coupled receptors family 1 profile domain-containing protein n=1 Tax=Hymenochirus boettgeri TaxID=247094 RepID=A0A8T2JS30_9PIPI|nr:hypothetical protein GDO86_013861 [Hymenochirus boettgeri]